MCWNFTVLYVATLRFLRFSFKIVFCDTAVLMVSLGLGKKPLGYGEEKIMYWLKIPSLVTTNTPGDV